jgi:hypothetical protein
LKLREWRLNVDIPNDPHLWESDFDELVESGARPEQLELITHHWLSGEGKARLMARIEEAEIKKEDARIERRNKRLAFYAQIVAMIVSLGGVLMGIIALLKR